MGWGLLTWHRHWVRWRSFIGVGDVAQVTWHPGPVQCGISKQGGRAGGWYSPGSTEAVGAGCQRRTSSGGGREGRND
jgi:hypothetical protein